MFAIKSTPRVLAVHVINPRGEKEHAIHEGEELESLIQTLGAEVIDRVVQNLEHPDNATYIGRGKVTEVAEKIKLHEIDVVVLNAMAKPRQVHALKTRLQKVNPAIEVLDRVDLILHIFDKHASTTEAKLQIELARMRYMGPRIYGMGFVMSRQGGGIGTLGVGETNTELMKRHWRNEIKKVTDQLEKITLAREKQLERRKRSGFKTVSIVGYTNAGKSSLYNALSKKDKLVENALFATLDSSIGKVYIPDLHEEVLITDTIGFIRNLPPRLIDAFKSTLMESVHADVLLHVIDVSDPEVNEKIKIVDDLLGELHINPENIIFVFNKTDAAGELNKDKLLQKYGTFSPLFVSVKKREGIEAIRQTIAAYLKKNHYSLENNPTSSA